MAKIYSFPSGDIIKDDNDEHERFLHLLTKFGNDPEFVEFIGLYKKYVGEFK